jgi:4a-hydroxytetrahydrobiopterin dehydratase
MARTLNDDEIARLLNDLPGWSRQGDTIVASIEAPDFPAAIRIVTAVADEAERMDHHPDIDIRWRTTNWLLTTHDAGGITQLDIELAHRINDAARAEGVDLHLPPTSDTVG